MRDSYLVTLSYFESHVFRCVFDRMRYSGFLSILLLFFSNERNSIPIKLPLTVVTYVCSLTLSATLSLVWLWLDWYAELNWFISIVPVKSVVVYVCYVE